MRVTIISDASHCPEQRVGGYGFWAVSQRGSHGGGGTFKCLMKDSTAAESMAIVNALHCALSLGIAADGDHVLIQTDCLNAIACLEETVHRKRADLAPAVERFKTIKAQRSLTIEFRHVRGHTRKMDQRSKAQRMSDQRAKRAMKSARQAAINCGVTKA